MSLLTQNYLTRGFWGDEAWTSLISQLPYLQMLKTTAADFHPPAYYTIVELVYKFLPPTEIMTRSISIVFYLLTILMVWRLATEVKDRLFGILSAIVVCVNPIFFTYAFEARNYTMFAFAATSSAYFLIKLVDKFNLKSAVFFVFFSTLGIYTHYFMFFILASQGLYLLLWERKIILRLMGLYLVIGLLYLPWIPFLASQVRSVSSDYWIGGIDKRTHFEAILRILGGEHVTPFRTWLFGLSAILLVIGIGQHLIRRIFEKPYLLIWLWALVPFVLATLPGLRVDSIRLPFRPIFFWRYLIGASVPLSMVMVHTAQKFPKILMWGSVGAVIVLSIMIDVLTFSRTPYTFREIYREKITDEIFPEEKLVTVLPSFAEVLYYRNRNNLKNELIVLPEGLVQSSGKSLLDAYVANGIVKITDQPSGKYYELRPGPNVVVSD